MSIYIEIAWIISNIRPNHNVEKFLCTYGIIKGLIKLNFVTG